MGSGRAPSLPRQQPIAPIEPIPDAEAVARQRAERALRDLNRDDTIIRPLTLPAAASAGGVGSNTGRLTLPKL